MENKKDISNKDLEKVAGGSGYQEWMYCKYCCRKTYQERQTYPAKGWDQWGGEHQCWLYDCLTCNNTNYYDRNTWKLI